MACIDTADNLQSSELDSLSEEGSSVGVVSDEGSDSGVFSRIPISLDLDNSKLQTKARATECRKVKRKSCRSSKSCETDLKSCSPASREVKRKSYSPVAREKKRKSYSPTSREIKRKLHRPAPPNSLPLSAPIECGQTSSVLSILNDISNTLGTVLQRLEKNEKKLESMEHKLEESTSSGSSSGVQKISPAIRAETRMVYKSLLDNNDDFTGFDVSSDTTFKDPCNQDVVKVLVNEVVGLNPSFSARDVRVAAHTYYRSLCQEDKLKERGLYQQRKQQRRRRERVIRRLAERQSQFNKMSYSESDRNKWQKVLIAAMMSSDESDVDENGKGVLVVHSLPWRSSKVSHFFEKLDAANKGKKSDQAVRQTKERVWTNKESKRSPPVDIPAWCKC